MIEALVSICCGCSALSLVPVLLCMAVFYSQTQVVVEVGD